MNRDWLEKDFYATLGVDKKAWLPEFASTKFRSGAKKSANHPVKDVRSGKIEITSQHSPLKSLNFAALKIKDAVCDRFREKTGLKREMDVTFRLFDDGLGFRYSFPDQPNLHNANISDELTEFAFAQNGTAWWKPAYLWNREEYLYNKTPLDAVGTAQTVMTVKLADGTHAALHEAALVDYAAMNLARSEGNTFKASLTPGAGAPKVTRAAPLSMSAPPVLAPIAPSNASSARPQWMGFLSDTVNAAAAMLTNAKYAKNTATIIVTQLRCLGGDCVDLSTDCGK